MDLKTYDKFEFLFELLIRNLINELWFKQNN